MPFSNLLDLLCRLFACDYSEIAEKLKDPENRKTVEDILKREDVDARLDGKWIHVESEGLTDDPIEKINCRKHGLPVLEEYLYNYNLEVTYKDLPCVISKDNNGDRYYVPLEIIVVTPILT